MSAPARLEAFIRAEFARLRAEPTRAPPPQPRHQTREGERPRQPAPLAAGDFGLADTTGREERAAASMTLAAAPGTGRESADATVVKCGACGLVIASRTAALAPRYCPRCVARWRALVLLRPLKAAHR